MEQVSDYIKIIPKQSCFITGIQTGTNAISILSYHPGKLLPGVQINSNQNDEFRFEDVFDKTID